MSNALCIDDGVDLMDEADIGTDAAPVRWVAMRVLNGVDHIALSTGRNTSHGAASREVVRVWRLLSCGRGQADRDEGECCTAPHT